MREPDYTEPLTDEQVQTILSGPHPANRVYPETGRVKGTVTIAGHTYFTELSTAQRAAKIWESTERGGTPWPLSPRLRQLIVHITIEQDLDFREHGLT